MTGIQQGTSGDGCQEGNAIEVRNTAGTGTPQVSVTGNTVSSYQKTGVLVKGQESSKVTAEAVIAALSGPSVTGPAPKALHTALKSIGATSTRFAEVDTATVRLSVTVRLLTTDGVPVSPPVAYRRADLTSMPS